eukprot:IDg17522t1
MVDLSITALKCIAVKFLLHYVCKGWVRHGWVSTIQGEVFGLSSEDYDENSQATELQELV